MKDKSSSRNPFTAYFIEAFTEFSKITWPTKEQAALLTGIVVGISLVLGLVLGAFDLGLSELYKLVLEKVSA